MFLNIPIISDIVALQEQQQKLIDQGLLKANAACISHDYQFNEQVLKKNHIGLSDQPTYSGWTLLYYLSTYEWNSHYPTIPSPTGKKY